MQNLSEPPASKDRGDNIVKHRYLVITEQADNNYSAYAPDVPGCISTGKTVEETLSNYREALQLHLEVSAEDGETFPSSYSVAAHCVEVEVDVPISTSKAG
jgi:predicted RNase H-like HicB family nuclease